MPKPDTASAPGRVRRTRFKAFRTVVALATAVVAMATTLAVAPTASATLTAVGPVDPTTGYPSWYQDSTGLQLQPCLDGPPACFATTADLVAPDGEFFYNNASAVVGDANIVLALEGAYAGRGAGQEIAFSRIRFFNKVGLQPGADYTVTHPYGTDVYTADQTGAILGKNATEDIGCLTPPCGASFAMANSSRLGPFITWDTFGAATGAPPAGYVGDGLTPHRIAPVANGVDYFRVEGPNINKTRANWCPGRTGDVSCIQTNLFSVEGKVIAGPAAVVNPDALDFGHQQAGTTSAARTVTLTSRGATAVSVGAAALGGLNPEDYSITADGCSTMTVAPGTTCSVDVTFHPTAARASSATLTIPDDTPAGSHVVALRGTTAPAASLSTTGMDFPSQKVGTTSAPQVITVSNTGSADLVIGAPTLAGTGASSFKVADNTCTAAIPPAGSCAISMAFAPTATGISTAELTVKDNGPSTHTVALTGAGIAPTQTLSRSTIGFPDQPVRVTSGQSTVTLTNTGTAPLTMQNVSIGGANAADFAIGTNTCAAGFEVVPNDGCSIGVTFTPSVAGSRNAVLTVTSDARTTNVPLSGNGVTPPDTVAPSAPGAPKAVADGATGMTVTWTASTDNVGVVRYHVFRDGATTATGSSTTTSFSDTGLGEYTSHSYTVKAVDAAGNVSAASLPATGRTADVTAPGVPVATATAAGTSSINVTWPVPSDNAGVTGYQVFVDGSTTALARTTASFAHTGLLAGSTHTYQVVAVDAAGNASARSLMVSATTTAQPTDTTAPTQTHSPGTGATGAAVAGNVTATFNEAVQGVSGTTFTLKNAAGAAVTATVTYNATTRVATLDPTATLSAGASYTATLTGGTTAIRDTANNPLATTSWSFTTGAAADTTAPTVSTRAPAVNATAASTTANLTATFNEAVQGVSGTSFTLKNAAGTAFAGTVTYNATTRVATLDPTATLPGDTKYTATLTGGASAIRDTAGNPLATASWTFTTGPAPTVSSRTPGSNATAVSTTGNITATFSEPVQSVSGATFALKNAAGAAIAGTVTYNATTRVATLDPTATLANDTRYTATLTGSTTAIRDIAGNPLGTTSWTFTTGPRPTVTARTPAVNATGVSRTGNITATFGENVTGVSGTTVTLKNTATGAAQTAVVTYNATSRVVTLNPSATLAASTKFTVALTNAIKDTIGNPLATTTWSFTTGTT